MSKTPWMEVLHEALQAAAWGHREWAARPPSVDWPGHRYRPRTPGAMTVSSFSGLGRSFYLLQLAALLNAVGARCGQLAIAWWVLDKTGDPLLFSLPLPPSPMCCPGPCAAGWAMSMTASACWRHSLRCPGRWRIRRDVGRKHSHGNARLADHPGRDALHVQRGAGPGAGHER